MQGIHPKETSFGGQLHYEFSKNLTVDDSFRYTDASGVFNTQFYNALPTASLIGSTVNGQTVASIKYADGPNQGQAYTGAYYNGNPNINTNMRDVGSLVNDLRASAKFDTDGLKITAFAGWFHMRQTIAMDWHVNQTFSDAAANGAMLDLFTAAGAQLTANGQAGFNNNWGNAANYAFNFTDDAPYVDVGFNFGHLDLDGSFRWNSVRADGWNDWDASILKNFNITEHDYFQLRIESFNVNNRPVFSSPNLTPNSGSFGQILGTANSPRFFQIGGRLVF